MKYDELAFVNLQLATMLREGIPLEGGLRQLCLTMERGTLRTELELMEKDLSAGVPLAQAASKRNLPEFYRCILQIGGRSNDLPTLLTLLADYYQNANLVWTRLKGVMVYPAIVLTLTAAFSVWVAIFLGKIYRGLSADRNIFGAAFLTVNAKSRGLFLPALPLPPSELVPAALLIGLAIPALAVALLPGLRRELQWRLPAFREASLARLAATMAILLKAGSSFSDAAGLLEKMESGTTASAELGVWKTRCAEGRAKFTEVAAGGRIFPPMFTWLVASAGENLAAGFDRAAQVYHARAAYRSNVLLYAALPASLLFLGLIVLSQIYPMWQLVFRLPLLFSR